MKNQPLLPPQSADWGRAMSQLIDETRAAALSLSQDVDVRFRGSDMMAQSLIGQNAVIENALANSQPVYVQTNTVNGLIVGPDPAPVTKITVQINTPPGYSSVMLQAYGSAFVQHDRSLPGSPYPVESQIQVVSMGTETGPVESSPIQDFNNIRYFQSRASYATFRPNIGPWVTVRLMMRNPGTANYNSGANTANLTVLANFYKDQVLKPPA